MQPTTAETKRPPAARSIGAVLGLVTAAFALGVAELVAGIVSTWKSPIFDVGDRVIELAPSFITKFAIDVFGTNDKPALLIGIAALLAVYGAVLGVMSFRRDVRIGLAGFGLFGSIGFIAVLTKATDPGLAATTPIVIGTALGALALFFAHRFITAAVTSSPRCAGRQCMKTASGLAAAISASST